MSNFSEQQHAKTEAREKDRTRREKMAGFFYNLAQLTFAALVLGGLTPLYTNIRVGDMNWSVILSGAILTCALAYTANKILKS